MATQADGIDPLKAFQDDGRAVIVAHLHPWVSPPHREKVSRQHSFPGNLEPALESEKLAILTQSIETNFGRRPTIYKAGRYGFGENTATILRAQHYEIDISPSPPFDFSAEGGPDFSSSSCDSFWLGEPRQLLGIPNSGGFVGGCGDWAVGCIRWPRTRDYAGPDYGECSRACDCSTGSACRRKVSTSTRTSD